MLQPWNTCEHPIFHYPSIYHTARLDAMPPKVLTKNGDRGVLPVSSTTRAAAKPPAPRLKLEIRRLPPGLTLSEFEEVMGDEWRLGNGKVDWREYRQGKVKQGLGKVAEQSRCYLHVVNEALVKELEARFLAVTFHDSAGTHKIPDLRHLPPTMGFAMMQRVPISSKIRADNRQGTIDTDAEFIAFLEAETQPIVKPAALDSVNVDKDSTEKVKVKTTPLIDALREKKANKAKAAATKDDKKEFKGHARKESKEAVILAKEGKSAKIQQQKVEQASKEAAKALNKQTAGKQRPQQRPASPQQPATRGPAPTGKAKKAVPNVKAQNAPPQAAVPTAPAASITPQASTTQRQRQRGNNAEGIKKMLQKDLGIKPKPASAGPKGQVNGDRPATPATANGKDKEKASPALNNPPANTSKVPTGPKQHQQQTLPNNAAQPPSNISTTKAYLKHANPSQGMTEILIQQILSQYGDVANVTIDPRKGTAIAIFKSPEGLKKALEARKVPVANGSIEVLEFKERNAGNNAGNGGGRGGFRGGRGGVRGGRGGGNVGGPPASAPAKAMPKNDSAS